MYKLTWCDEKDMLKEMKYLKEFNFNRIPQPFKLTTKERFDSMLDIYSPCFTGIGQIFNEEDIKSLVGEEGKVTFVRINYYFFTDVGYGVCKFTRRVPEETKYPELHNNYKCVDETIYIEIGCQHKGAKVVRSDRFERVYKCEDCGLTWSEQTGY